LKDKDDKIDGLIKEKEGLEGTKRRLKE